MLSRVQSSSQVDNEKDGVSFQLSQKRKQSVFLGFGKRLVRFEESSFKFRKRLLIRKAHSKLNVREAPCIRHTEINPLQIEIADFVDISKTIN